MMTDPDGNYAWAVINAGFAAYDGYKAYKAGKASGKQGWALAGSVAAASGSSFVKVGHLKKAGKLLYAGEKLSRTAERTSNGIKKGRKISDKQAINRLRKGKDVYSPSRKQAKKIQKKASFGKKKVIRDEAHIRTAGSKARPHFHDKKRANGSHSFY